MQFFEFSSFPTTATFGFPRTREHAEQHFGTHQPASRVAFRQHGRREFKLRVACGRSQSASRTGGSVRPQRTLRSHPTSARSNTGSRARLVRGSAPTAVGGQRNDVRIRGCSSGLPTSRAPDLELRNRRCLVAFNERDIAGREPGERLVQRQLRFRRAVRGSPPIARPTKPAPRCSRPRGADTNPCRAGRNRSGDARA